jgi:uncharacterized protein (DUF1778 family)
MHKLSKQIGVRLPPKLHELLNRITNARGEDISDFVRRAIYKELATLNLLPEEQKKALGLKQVNSKSLQEGKR